MVSTGVWYHVAGVRGSNFTQIYVNGVLERQTNVSFAQSYTNLPLYFASTGESYWDHKLKGRLDEVSLYNRDLGASEIAAIYAAGSAGKCKPPKPVTITAQPQSLLSLAGTNAVFSLAATGTTPIGYQWLRNGVALSNGGNISGATGPSLVVANVQSNDAGAYMAVATNIANSTTSAVAVLTVFVPPPTFPWEASDIGAVWSDNFERAALGSNWVVLGNANTTIVSNQLQFAQTNVDNTRQVYYDPWMICSDSWTLRWSEQFGAWDSNSLGVGIGLKNFQAAGGDDRGYNLVISGAGTDLGKLLLQRWNGSAQVLLGSGAAMGMSAGDIVDCALTRSAWTLTATASNRTTTLVSTFTTNFGTGLLSAPSISRVCCYPLSGTVNVDDMSFTINHRKPARFIFIGASTMEGYNATSIVHRCVNVVQSNYTEAVCNDSASWNSTTNAVSVLPEILAHQPATAILEIGGNDLLYNYPASQWQSNYAYLVSQLQFHGVRVMHSLGPPRTPTDVTPLKNWITSNYPPADLIDFFTPMVSGASSLQAAFDSGDGVHLNDAGETFMGQIVISNLPPGIRTQPQSENVLIGSNVSFTVAATGTPPLTYQWYFNGTNALSDGGKISGSATPTLTIINALRADAGVYGVVVSNPKGNTTNWPSAILTVQPPSPQIGPVAVRNGLISFTWNSLPGQTYRLQFKSDLKASAWQDIVDVPATNVTTTVTESLGSPQGFYRLFLVP